MEVLVGVKTVAGGDGLGDRDGGRGRGDGDLPVQVELMGARIRVQMDRRSIWASSREAGGDGGVCYPTQAWALRCVHQ